MSSVDISYAYNINDEEVILNSMQILKAHKV